MSGSRDWQMMRRLVGSLLASGYSDRELQVLAMRLRHDPVFAVDLGLVLEDVLQIYESILVGGGADLDHGSERDVRVQYLVDSFVEGIRRKRIPKAAVVSVLKKYGWKSLSPNQPTKKIVRDFIVDANADEIRRFADWLNVSLSNHDPYLSYISERAKS